MSMPRTRPSINPRTRLRAYVETHPTQRAAAQSLGVSAPFLCLMLSGRKRVSERILVQLGLTRSITIQER